MSDINFYMAQFKNAQATSLALTSCLPSKASISQHFQFLLVLTQQFLVFFAGEGTRSRSQEYSPLLEAYGFSLPVYSNALCKTEKEVLLPWSLGMMHAQYCKYFQIGKRVKGNTEAQVEGLDVEKRI